MNFKTALGGEHLVAHFTLKVFHSCVSLDMSCQSALHSKRSKTLSAFIWLFMSVYPDVSNKVTRFFKLLSTISALMPSDSIDLK